MSVKSLFATHIYESPLIAAPGARRALNSRLLRECQQLRYDDESGQRWSEKNYPGGYTSYNSASRMYELSPTFANLRKYLDGHVRKYVRTLEWDMERRELAMTDCWVNIMPHRVVHSLHLHPLSAVSGTYYVQTPRGAPGLKLEDPRLDRFMAAPPRKSTAKLANKPWVVIPAQAGSLVLFESWLRHEVTPNSSQQERVSISFNYSWF